MHENTYIISNWSWGELETSNKTMGKQKQVKYLKQNRSE